LIIRFIVFPQPLWVSRLITDSNKLNNLNQLINIIELGGFIYWILVMRGFVVFPLRSYRDQISFKLNVSTVQNNRHCVYVTHLEQRRNCLKIVATI